MPMNDWTRVEAGIFHAFHHHWTSAISHTLNSGLLPGEYYALPEQVAGAGTPDVFTLQFANPSSEPSSDHGTVTTVLSRPQTRFVVETENEVYRRKKNSIVIRHISGHRIVALIEIISPNNKSSLYAFQSLVTKACDFIERRVHLLLIDPFAPGPRDPNGIHAAVWQNIEGSLFVLPPDKPLTMVAYECDQLTRAYIDPIAVGDTLPTMPVFLEPGFWVPLALETTYQATFTLLPRHLRETLAQ